MRKNTKIYPFKAVVLNLNAIRNAKMSKCFKVKRISGKKLELLQALGYIVFVA